MKRSSSSLAQQIRFFITAALFVLAGLVLIAQLAGPEFNADDAAGAGLLALEASHEDNGRSIDNDTPLDTPPATVLLAAEETVPPLPVAHYLFSSYLISFIGAPPRAPPAHRSV